MPFENEQKCQFLKIDMRDIALDKNNKIRPLEKDSIQFKHNGTYKKSVLISNKRVLIFSAKEVWLLDISDKIREIPIKLDFPHPDLGEIHRVISFMA